MKQGNHQGVLSGDYARITVLDTRDGKEIAVITNEMITTADDAVVVKLKPAP